MNNKRTLIIIGAVAAVIFIIGIILFFISRGNAGDDEPQITTIVYWGLWEPESVMKPLIDAYESENPHIEIEYVQRSFTQYEATAFTRIQQNAVADTPAPDIIRINNTWLPKFQGSLTPLPTGVMSSSQYADAFYPTAVNDFTGTDGQIYAIPLEIDGLALFYNKKLLNEAEIEAPPTDWDTFIANAKKMTKTDGATITQAGAALGTAKNIKHSADILSLLLLQNGVQITDSSASEVTLTSTRAQSALEFYTNFLTVHKTWSPDLATDLEAFYSGNLAMMLAPSWRAFDVINSAPEIEFGIAPMPQLPGNNEVNYAMYWGEAVAATSDHPQEAWEFIEWLSQSAQQKEMFSNASQIRAFGEPYSRKSLASELSDHQYVAAFMDMAPTMKAWKMGEQTFIEESIRTAINDVAEGGADIDSALNDAQERINEKLATEGQ